MASTSFSVCSGTTGDLKNDAGRKAKRRRALNRGLKRKERFRRFALRRRRTKTARAITRRKAIDEPTAIAAIAPPERTAGVAGGLSTSRSSEPRRSKAKATRRRNSRDVGLLWTDDSHLGYR